ncbi:MAG: CPBP family intramembrane glutamic endopeptidase [Chloroflexota bacterium]
MISQVFRRVRLSWLFASFLLFPALAAAAILLYATIGGEPLALRTTQLLPQAIVILLVALGEEFGWRGYALPKLQQSFGPLSSSLILGLVWGFWHYPGYLIGVGLPLEMPFVVFLLWVLLATILMTWFFNRTGSLLAAILMHIAANATFNYLPLLPEFAGQQVTFLIFLSLLGVIVVSVVANSKLKKPELKSDC